MLAPHIHAISFVASVFVLASVSALQAESPVKPPNVVIILADDLGYGDLSCYDGWIKTPHLDKLAASGLRFTDFHSNGAVCSPTRASLMTGRYPDHVGIPGVVLADPKQPAHQHGMADDELTLAEAFSAAGYRTAMFGKWHLGYYPRFNPSRHGFDSFRGYVSGNVDFFTHIDQAGNFDWWENDTLKDDEGYVTHLITKYALSFLDQHASRDDGRPFFLYLPHEAPHYPYQGPGDKPIRFRDGPINVRQRERNRKRDREAYRQMVIEMDRSTAKVLTKLDQLGLTKNTIVWFMSDNGASGYMGSNGVLRGHKGQVWEGGHRVPSFVRWPGKVRPSTTDITAATMDVMPTLARIAGLNLNPSKPLDGRDLSQTLLANAHESLPNASDRSGQHRVIRWTHGQAHAVRRGRWKLVIPGRNKPAQLFRIKPGAPSETENLASSFPNIVDELARFVPH